MKSDPAEINSRKKALRAQIKRVLGAMTPEERKKKSAAIIRRFTRLAAFKNNHTIMAYASFGTEVETSALLRACFKHDKELVLPRMKPDGESMQAVLIADLERDLVKHKLGFMEPHSKAHVLKKLIDIDLIVLPGLAFDLNGNRLGRGLGCYDRYLEEHDTHDLSEVHTKDGGVTVNLKGGDGLFAAKYGFAFECQIVDEVPADGHDQRVDFIVTEDRIVGVHT